MTAARLPFFEARIAGLVGACCTYPIATLLIATLLTVGAGTYASRNFAIQTDTGKLISPDLPWRWPSARKPTPSSPPALLSSH